MFRKAGITAFRNNYKVELMNAHFKELLSFALLILCFASRAHSADTLNTTRSKLFFDNIQDLNIWTRSSNPAGIVFFENLRGVNLVEVKYFRDKKGIKFPAEPGLTNSFNADTRGFKKLGRMTFSGSFSYLNEHYNDLFYNNTQIFDPDNPYILGDTVGGKQQKEGFVLTGSVAFPLSSRLSIGLEVDYENYVGAKLKDPRNKNDISSLTVRPGIIFSSGIFQTGISGGPIVTNNDVSVSVTEDAKYSLLQFLGFGYYKPVLNIYSYSNTYYGSGYTTQAQVKVTKGRYTNFLTAGYISIKEEVRYGSSKRLTDGISVTNILSVSDAQIFKRADNLHQIDVSFNMKRITGTEMMQHFKTVVSGSFRYDTLITDMKTKGKHIATNYTGGLEYRWSGYDGDSESFRLIAGVNGEYMATSHYPVETNGAQEVMNITPYAGFKKFFLFNSLILIPEIGVRYRTNLHRDKTYTITKWSEPEYQQLDFIARSSGFIRGNAAISIIKETKYKNFPEYFIDLNSSYLYFPQDLTGTEHNFYFGTSVGLIF